MRRRDLGTAALAGFGLVALGATREAQAADTLVKGTGTGIKSLKGSDGKFYLLPKSTVKVKPGSQIQLRYEGMTGEPAKPTFKLVDVGTGKGKVEFDVLINGPPSTSFAESPTAAIVIDSAGSHPIDVQQPGG